MSISNTILDSDYNAFKNLQVSRGTLNLPTSVTNGSVYTSSATFTIDEAANFIVAFAETTDYKQYFTLLDSQYHDTWRRVNSVTPNTNDYLLFSDSASVESYQITLQFSGNSVTVTLSYKNISGSTQTFNNHPTHVVKIAFVEYTLAQ